MLPGLCLNQVLACISFPDLQRHTGSLPPLCIQSALLSIKSSQATRHQACPLQGDHHCKCLQQVICRLQGYANSGNLDAAMATIKWAAEFLMSSHLFKIQQYVSPSAHLLTNIREHHVHTCALQRAINSKALLHVAIESMQHADIQHSG